MLWESREANAGRATDSMHALCRVNLTELPLRPPRLDDLESITVFVGPDELPTDAVNRTNWCLRAYPSITQLVPLASLQAVLVAPRKGVEIPGAGGFRKIRFSREGSNKGKSGSYRVIYLYVQAYATVFLVLVFGKSDKDNISKADTNALAKRAGELNGPGR